MDIWFCCMFSLIYRCGWAGFLWWRWNAGMWFQKKESKILHFNIFALSLSVWKKHAGCCPVKGIFLLLLSGKFLPSLWTHVTSSTLTLWPNIADQTSMFGFRAKGETTGSLIQGPLTSSKYVWRGNTHVQDILGPYIAFAKLTPCVWDVWRKTVARCL